MMMLVTIQGIKEKKQVLRVKRGEFIHFDFECVKFEICLRHPRNDIQHKIRTQVEFDIFIVTASWL